MSKFLVDISELLSILKTLSEEKAQPINRIIEDLVQYALISIGRDEFYHEDVQNIKVRAHMSKNNLLIILDRYKRLNL